MKSLTPWSASGAGTVPPGAGAPPSSVIGISASTAALWLCNQPHGSVVAQLVTNIFAIASHRDLLVVFFVLPRLPEAT